MVTTTRTEETTPKPNDIIAPEITTDKQKTTPKSQKQLKDVVKTYKAKKFTTQLQQKDFCDTGTFTKVNQEQKEEILERNTNEFLKIDPQKIITCYEYIVL